MRYSNLRYGNLRKIFRTRYFYLSCLILLVFTIIFLLSVKNVYSLDITLAWDENTEGDLAGYKIFCREVDQSYNYNSPVWEGMNTTCTITGLNSATTYYFVARAYNTSGLESDDSDEVCYQPTENMVPLANAGPDQMVNETDTVTLNGLNSSDPDGNIAAYMWDQILGTVVQLSDSTDAQPTFIAPSIDNDLETLTFQLTVTDDEGLQSTDTCEVTIINIPDSNLAPAKPIITSPNDGQMDCELMLQITTGPFSDPDSDSHGQSRWQISDQVDFSSLVLDITTKVHLTELTVPHFILESNTTYYIRIQFSDIYMESSEWSDTIRFTTVNDIDDLNANGIPDEKEVDNNIDLNMDGIADNEQSEVIKSIQFSDSNSSTGIYKLSDSINSIIAIDTIDPLTITDNTKRPNDLSFELLSFKLQVNNPGDTVSVRIYFSEDIPDNPTFYKYDTVNGWQDFSEYVTFNASTNSITIAIQDGGNGDSDGVANGIIVDPGCLVAASNILNYDNGSPTIENYGCFIETLFSNL